MDQILQYITDTYDPVSIIVYGSYADGTNTPHSDFDALVISRSHRQFHDSARVAGVPLDVFVYPQQYFAHGYDPDEFLPVMDGIIVLDSEGNGTALKDRVATHFRTKKSKSADELRASLDWCQKMLTRNLSGTVEGMYRWHWLLTDSLEIFCDTVHQPYLGPKKSLAWMEHHYPEAFALYQAALRDFSEPALTAWICFLTKSYPN